MLKFKPFCSIRYNQSIQNLGDVLAPPYDVISESEQAALYEKHPHNIVRLDLGKQFESDTDTDNRYTRAKQTFDEWLSSSILVSDSDPSYYFYSHTYSVDGQVKELKGVFGAGRLHAFEDRMILPHENTMPGPIEDRLRLTQACEANLSPVYTLFDDPDGAFFALAAPVWESAPVADASMADGDRYRLWRVVDPGLVDRIFSYFTNKKLLIADGHHRYTTALHYQALAKQHGAVSDATSDYTLLFATPIQNPGLTIYPTHRAIWGLPDFDSDLFLKKLELFFEKDHCHDVSDFKKRSALDVKKSIGVMFPGRSDVIRLTLRDGVNWDELAPPETSAVLRGLDVSILQNVILQHLLGYTLDDIRRQHRIRYLKSDDAVISALADGETQAVFVLQATRLDEMRDVCLNGEKMPQKSTYFYPKLITGLVINPVVPSQSSAILTDIAG